MAVPSDIDLRAVRDSETGCLRWQGSHNDKGYGQIFIGGRSQRVHRVQYERLIGPIPDGFDVDHVRANGCRHRDCVEPTHLEAVTHRENLRRRNRFYDEHPGRDACPAGHDYTPENLYVDPDGNRNCRTCRDAGLMRKRTCPSCAKQITTRNYAAHLRVHTQSTPAHDPARVSAGATEEEQ